jgi:hypothetical protein
MVWKNRSKYGYQVKPGYGFADYLVQNDGEFPVFSYYWHGWKKAGLFNGHNLRAATMNFFQKKQKDCKIVLTPNTRWTTINLLIPVRLLKENDCIINIVDFDEKEIL